MRREWETGTLRPDPHAGGQPPRVGAASLARALAVLATVFVITVPAGLWMLLINPRASSQTAAEKLQRFAVRPGIFTAI